MSNIRYQNSLQEALSQIILSTDLSQKISLAQSLSSFPVQKLEVFAQVDLFKKPGRPDDFLVVSARKVPKRSFQDLQGRAQFLHAIANIELFAIELPALCLLRFGSDDLDFIAEQIQIIKEEAKHFYLLSERLTEMGFAFGSFPVHYGLWDYAWKCSSELEHQIIIPCYLEARGLDVTPGFIQKFKDIQDEKSAAIMQLIYEEEIGHVESGQQYLQNQAQKVSLSSDELFERTLRKFFQDKIKSKVPLNVEGRKQAGFTTQQLKLLSSDI